MCKLLAALLLLVFSTSSLAAERIVVLAPAAADIIKKLEAAELVVGKTRNVAEFPQAKRIGSHIRPNLELITALNPDLLVISSNKFFSQEMAAKVDAELFHYNPESLEDILQQTSRLAKRLAREDQALKLIGAQWQKLKRVEPLTNKPKVIYEITEIPLTVAGSKNILADIIRAAGGIFINTGHRKMLRFNAEAILARRPDIYIWQVGPMNQNPTPPAQRGQYRFLPADFLRVEQLQYSRANTQSFDNVLELNTYFHERQN